jgi:hypothetical protein
VNSTDKDLIALELMDGPWTVEKHNRSGLLQYELRPSPTRDKRKYHYHKARVLVGGKTTEGKYNRHSHRWSVVVDEIPIEQIPRIVKFLQEVYPIAMAEREAWEKSESMAEKEAWEKSE